MLGLYHESKKVGYTPGYFLRMLSELGPTETARRLIEADTPSDGFTRLYELHRLDLTVEALAITPEWSELFTSEQRRAARDRLITYGWNGKLPDRH
jgi:hypothetical protein